MFTGPILLVKRFFPGFDWPAVPVLPSDGLLVFALKILFPPVVFEAGGTEG